MAPPRGARIPVGPLLLILGCTVCQMGAGLFYASRALAPDVIADLGWTRAMWSSAMAPMLLVSSLGQAVVGAACVRFGVRPVVVTSVLCLGATFGVLAGMQSLWQFHAAMVLLALGNAGIGDVAIGSVVTRWFDRHRGLALGIAFVGSNLGAVLFVHTIASLSSRLSWREATLYVGLGAVAMILPFAIFVVRDPSPAEARHDAAAKDEPGSLGPATSVSVGTAMRGPAFWILFYAIFCYALVQLGMVDHLILHLRDLGYSREEAAGALELAVGAGIVAKLGAGLLVPRVSAKTALIANTSLLASSLALVPFAEDPRILTLFGVLFGISTAARDVLLPLAVADAFGARYFAQVYGMMMLAYFPGGGLGPIVLGGMHDLIGTYRPGFYGCLFLTVTAVVALAFVPRRAAVVREPEPTGVAPGAMG